MYKFRYLKTHYRIEICTNHSNGSKHSISMSFSVIAKYQNVENRYTFAIDRKKIEWEDYNNDDNPAHNVMVELGNTLYPIVMYVSDRGAICGIANFEEICKRREAICREIMDTAYSVSTATYIELSRSNFADEKIFLNTFCNQLFIQLLFLDLDNDNLEIRLQNSRYAGSTDIIGLERGANDSYNLVFNSSGDNSIECQLSYTLSNLGDILSVNGTFINRLDDGVINTSIKITSEMDDRIAKKENKLLSFLFD